MNVGKHLIIGSVAALLLTTLLFLVFVDEGARLEQETLAQQGRSIARGAALYDAYCANCHGVRGGGRPGVAPPLNIDDLWDGRRGLAFYGSPHDYTCVSKVFMV